MMWRILPSAICSLKLRITRRITRCWPAAARARQKTTPFGVSTYWRPAAKSLAVFRSKPTAPALSAPVTPRRPPIAAVEDRPLSKTVGAVLDPVCSLRCRVRLQPNETARIVFTTGVGSSREQTIALAEKYFDANIFERESRMAWTRAQVEMSHLHIVPDEAHL